MKQVRSLIEPLGKKDKHGFPSSGGGFLGAGSSLWVMRKSFLFSSVVLLSGLYLDAGPESLVHFCKMSDFFPPHI